MMTKWLKILVGVLLFWMVLAGLVCMVRHSPIAILGIGFLIISVIVGSRIKLFLECTYDI